MRIAVLTSGILPVPAVKGGAVENLIDFYLEYNEHHHLHNITVYSVWNDNVVRHPAHGHKYNHYIYIKTNSWWGKLKKLLYAKLHGDGYYHHSIEFFLHEAMKDLRRKQYDVIIVENRPAFVLSLADGNEKYPQAQRYVLHLHNDFLHAGTRLASAIYEKYDCVVGVSDYITGRVNEIDTTKQKAVTVYNSIDISLFTNAVPGKRDSLGLSPSDFVIVYSGRLNEEKGILELVQAIRKCEDIPHLKLLVIGASSYGRDEHPTPFVKQLEAEAEAIRDKVLYTGFVSYEQIPSFLKMANLAVVPSMWEEPFGLTVVEAMATGLPLITTRSGGIPEICEGVATIVGKDHIVDGLAEAIRDLYLHPEKRKQMSGASVRRAELYDKEAYAHNFFEAICNHSNDRAK